MNKFVYFIDTEFFIYTVETQATYPFIKHILCRLTITVRYNQQRKFTTKFRQQNLFIPLAFHIKCGNNFNNSKTQHQAKNIKVYIFLSEAIR